MVEPYIETSVGRKFYALAADPGFVIAEIAEALSKLCRYGGHCSQFYSVAEHSVLVSEIMETLKIGDPFEGLMHDVSEAYLVDIPGPWKRRLPDYCEMEAQLEAKIQRFFSLPPKTAECKHADLIALMVEGRALLPSRGETMIQGGIPAQYGELADAWIAKHGRSIFGLTPAGARTGFLHRYEKLTKRRK
jgi:hypothetical protein